MDRPVTEAEVAALVESVGLDATEPARMVCHEVDFGRGLECEIIFAGRHVTGVGLRPIRANPARREADREMLRRRVWQQFWRYLGAA